MRALIITLLVAAGCTRPNPNRCCSEEADCRDKGIPVGSMCDQGLVCRGNQCIAQPCTSNSQCDPAAPFCIEGLCAESCSEDSQCPGASQDPDQQFCVAAGCVTCRDSADCGGNAPVCETGTCRACTAHSECASQVCEAGACVAESMIAYASPAGSATSGCTSSAPCTFVRALAVVDPTRAVIKLLPGTHTYSPQAMFAGEFPLSVYGPGTLANHIFVSGGSGTSATSLRLVDLDMTSSIECGTPATQVGTVRLERVNATYAGEGDGGRDTAIAAYSCAVDIIDSSIRLLDPYVFALRIAGTSGAATGQRARIERSRLEKVESPGTALILVGEAASLQIANSIFKGATSATYGAIGFGSNVGPSSIKFSTFYNAILNCSSTSANLSLASQNNIFLNERAGAPANTVIGTECVHSYVLVKPQSTAVNGANNFFNMDPRFVDPANNDFHLLAGSPAIDKADPAATQAVDFDGTARPQGAGRDLGAFEFK